MASAGSLQVFIDGNTAGLEKAIDGATGGLKKFLASIGPAGIALAAVGAAAVTATTAIGLLTKKGLSLVDSQAKLARSVGGSIDAVRALQIAAGDAGVDNLAGHMEKLDRAMGQAMQGTGRAGEALKRLGLSATELSVMDLDQRMATMADSIRDLGLSTGETSAIMGDLGVRGADMTRWMMEGGDAIRSAMGEVQDFGVSLSAVDAAKVEMANDAMSRIGMVIEAITQQLAVKLAPYIKAVADLFSDFGKQGDKTGDMIERAVEGVVTAIGWIGDRIQNVRVGIRLLSVVQARIWQAMLQGINWVVQGFERLKENAIESINTLIRAAKKVPGAGRLVGDEIAYVSSKTSDFISAMAQAAEDTTKDAIAALNEEAEKEKFSEKWERVTDKIKRDSQNMAEEVVKNQRHTNLALVEDVQATSEKIAEIKDDDEAKERERLERLFNQTMTYLQTEQERLIGALEEREAILEWALESRLMTEEEYLKQLERLWADYEKSLTQTTKEGEQERTRLRQLSWQQQLGMVGQILGSMAGMLDGENRKQFELQKKLSLASVIVSGVAAAAQAFAIYGPTPAGFISAGVAAAQTAAQVAVISRTQYGAAGGGYSPSGGGGSGSMGGGGGSTQGEGPRSGTLTVSGMDTSSLFTGSAVIQIAEELLEYQRQGGKVVFQS